MSDLYERFTGAAETLHRLTGRDGHDVVAVLGSGLGSVPGIDWKRNWRWARFIAGRDRAPSAWDHLFQDQPTGGIRCKLKSGMWIAGLYAETSAGTRPFASGYPDPQDLFLPAILQIHTESGELVLDANGRAVVLDQGALLRWRDIEYLEFVPTE